MAAAVDREHVVAVRARAAERDELAATDVRAHERGRDKRIEPDTADDVTRARARERVGRCVGGTVAGAAALYLQGAPGSSPQQVRDGLFALTTKNVVTDARSTNAHLLFSNL